MKRYNWLSLAACLLAGLIWGLPRPGQSARPERRIIAKIEIPPGDGLETLQRVAQATGFTLHMLPEDEPRFGDRCTEHRVVLSRVTPAAAVRAVFAACQLGPYRIADGQIHVGECCETRAHIRSRLYDVGFLLDVADVFDARCRACDQPKGPPATAPNAGQGNRLGSNRSTASGAGGFGGGGFPAPARPPTREEVLCQTVVRIAVGADMNGGALAHIVGRRMIITCSLASHDRVQQAIDELAASIQNKENRP